MVRAPAGGPQDAWDIGQILLAADRSALIEAHSPSLVVVCTSACFAVRSQLASCVPFHAVQFGFAADCVAQCENTLSIDKRQLDRAGAGRIGVLDEMRSAGGVIAHSPDPLGS